MMHSRAGGHSDTFGLRGAFHNRGGVVAKTHGQISKIRVSWPNLQNVLMSGLSGQSGRGQKPASHPQPLKNTKYRCRKATYDLLLDCLMVTIIDQP
jgi:hypothetical protein